jgi:hypothetical protein
MEHTNTLCGQSKSKLLYDWRFTANQFVLASSPLRPTTRFFFQLNSCGYSPYVASSLTSRWVVWAECRDFIYKNPVRTSEETHQVSITKSNRLMLFREIIPVYCENHMEHTNTLCGQNSDFLCVKAGGAYSYRCAFKGLTIREIQTSRWKHRDATAEPSLGAAVDTHEDLSVTKQQHIHAPQIPARSSNPATPMEIAAAV